MQNKGFDNAVWYQEGKMNLQLLTKNLFELQGFSEVNSKYHE